MHLYGGMARSATHASIRSPALLPRNDFGENEIVDQKSDPGKKKSATTESFHGSSFPPPTFFNEIAAFETSSRPYLLKYKCSLSPPLRDGSIVLCKQDSTWKMLFGSILLRVEQPRNIS